MGSGSGSQVPADSWKSKIGFSYGRCSSILQRSSFLYCGQGPRPVDWQLLQKVWLQRLVVQVLLPEQPQWDECCHWSQEGRWDSVGQDQGQFYHHQCQKGCLNSFK